MRRPKVDRNQKEIVAGLRAVGCSVLHLHGVHDGCPDILVGYRNRNILLEIKSSPQAKLNLTPAQEKFFATWRGQAAVVCSLEEAMDVVGVYGALT